MAYRIEFSADESGRKPTLDWIRDARAARAGLVRAAGRRPAVHDLWAMLDAGLERQRYEAEGVAGHEVYGRCEVRLGCGRGAAYARRRSTP